MKREVVAEKGIWTGKKHYVLNVLDSEGVTYKEPKLKVQGIEAVRSSTPIKIRDLIKQTLKVLLEADEDRLIKFIEDARKFFYRLSPEDQAFPRGVSRLNKYYDKHNIYRKSTPIQVRAALLYNDMLKKLSLDNKYDMINSGEKIKFLYLKLPNRVKENVIGFMNVLPKEFRVSEQIDLEKQFEKGYLEPIRTIVESIGWKTEKQVTLEEFF
jgi:DNA polymerase elongation subunit (family B)